MSKEPFKYAHVDFTGMRFGRLTVIGKSNSGKIRWKCLCDCGNERELIPSRLFVVKSCGCLSDEHKRNFGKCNKTHGMTKTRLYHIWSGVKDRCKNSNANAYSEYGGRGIKICEEWENDFLEFEKWALGNGYNEKLSLDRINTNGDYEPSNCRWATPKQQARNTRRTIYMDYKGSKIPVAEFCEDNNIYNRSFVLARIAQGVSWEQILTDWDIKQNPNYLTVKQAAIHFGVTRKTIHNWMEKGIIKAEKHGKLFYINSLENPIFSNVKK